MSPEQRTGDSSQQRGTHRPQDDGAWRPSEAEVAENPVLGIIGIMNSPDAPCDGAENHDDALTARYNGSSAPDR